MQKRCKIVLIDNLTDVLAFQSDYFFTVLEHVRERNDKISSMLLTRDGDHLHISLDDYEFDLENKLVIVNSGDDEKEIEKKGLNILEEIDKSDDTCKTIFVVDLYLDEDNHEYETGIKFAKTLSSKIDERKMKIVYCSGVLDVERVVKIEGFDMFHRSIKPGDYFSSITPAFQESRYKDKIDIMKRTNIKEEKLIYLLDLLTSNSYQNTQYLGDLLTKSFLFYEGEE